MQSFLAQCPLDVLEQKGVVWIGLCTKICNAKIPANGIPIAYAILNEIVTKSVNSNELGKALTANLLTKILESTTIQPVSCATDILSIYETALRHYPGPCGSSRGIIHKQTNRFIDSQDEDVIRLAGKCMLMLQQIRGGGVQGTSHKTMWLQYQLQLLGSVHVCLDEMFSNTHEKFDGSAIKERLDIPKLKLSDEPVTKAAQIMIRCGNLLKFLEIMIV